ncbi:hypothetical protein I656_00785 [Geobacillus sp. WSUCF1]|nr:hypothetical protein I656_00785 [Geobacillus sp. WSUCF1]
MIVEKSLIGGFVVDWLSRSKCHVTGGLAPPGFLLAAEHNR